MDASVFADRGVFRFGNGSRSRSRNRNRNGNRTLAAHAGPGCAGWSWISALDGPDTFSEEVRIDADGNTNNELAVEQPPFLLTDRTPFTVWVDYTGATHEIAISIARTTTKPSTPIAMQTDDLSRLGTAWFGLTAATQTSSETHRILSWKLVVTP